MNKREPEMRSKRKGQLRDGESQNVAEEEDNGSIHLILTDPEVLDCPVCFTTFTSPVFECDNGHAICSSCCTKLEEKCPTCCSPIGKHRCRTIEKALESLKAVCQNAKYGCKETVSYSKKHDHEMSCHHAPCTCPLPNCNFVGSSTNLYQHFSADHKGSAFRFRYRTTFDITIGANKLMILQEENDGELFVLNSKGIQHFGNVISVSCIAPSWKKESSCHISYMDKGRISFRFDVDSIQQWVDNPPSVGCLLLPSDFFDSNGQLELYMRIYSVEDSDSD